MTKIHDNEKEQFRRLFEQERIDNFKDRFKVLEIFLQTEHHVTSEELIQLVENSGYKLDNNFIKDTMEFMCRFGFAQKSVFNNGIMRYEHKHLCARHHDHMICTKCRKITEFSNNQLEHMQMRIAKDYGFHILQHKTEIYGICHNCFQDQVKIMSLVMAKQGERLVIKEIRGGSKAHMRLLTMGLRIGDVIDVIANFGVGQMVVAADCKRYVLGHGLAQKIFVTIQ